MLTAAKVLAVSRLLNKRIGQEDAAPPLLESIKVHLTSERRRLLAMVDLILVDPKSSLQQLVDATSAFCVVTSSSFTDAMRHFHDLRLDNIKRLSSSSHQGGEDVLDAFDYYIRSLRTSKLLLGPPFSEALRDLRSHPILRSLDIRSLDELDLASVQQFIPAEILSFVPWIKHADSKEIEEASMLETWSHIAFKEIFLGLRHVTDAISDISEMLAFRARLLQFWLPVKSSTPTHSNSGTFDALKNILDVRINGLLCAEAGSLSAITSDIESILEMDDSSTPVSPLLIWDHDFVTMPLGKGASSYRKELMNRHLGQSKTTYTILTSLQKWTVSLSDSLERIQQLRMTRWIDFIEDHDQDDEKTEQMERALQKDDPDAYEQEHKSSVGNAIFRFQKSIKEAVERLDKTETRKAIFLLRTIRGIHQYLAISLPHQQDLTILSSAVPHLHQLLAANTASILLDLITSSSTFLKKHESKALIHLWEGDPALPTHPSPRVFKLLQRLTTIMADQGPDLWSTDAVHAIKRAVRRGIMDKTLLQLGPRAVVNGAPDPLVNGNGTTHRPKGELEQQISIQILFDILYLSNALATLQPEADQNSADTDTDSSQKEDPRPKTLDDLIQTTKQAALTSPLRLDPAATLVLEARARDYWARTSLLFGLLA